MQVDFSPAKFAIFYLALQVALCFSYRLSSNLYGAVFLSTQTRKAKGKKA